MNLKVHKTELIEGIVKAPPSKSYTHRALIISFLAEGQSKLKYPLYSEDTLASLNACRSFGCEIISDNAECIVQGTGGNLKTPDNVLDVKNSGTTLRLMTSVASLCPDYVVITGDDSLRKRPMQDLLDSLKNLGVTVFSARGNGMPPIIVKRGFVGGSTEIKGSLSSQFLSSMLIASPYAEKPVNIHISGDLISKPYVDMTVDIIKKFGVKIDHDNYNFFHVDPNRYKAREYVVEGDYSSASYIIGAAAVLDSKVKIKNLFKNSKQGDKRILDILARMGASIKVKKDEILIKGNKTLYGTNIDLRNNPDLLPTVAAVGAVSEGITKISGVEHARYKETDRIHACALELSKLGVNVKELKDGLIVESGAKGGVVDSHGDHRLVMALSIVGLKVGNVIIKNASVYDVSFPNFPKVMNNLGCRIET
jgi:3-phosphoshikimate 1-carboxyvinyltransferase